MKEFYFVNFFTEVRIFAGFSKNFITDNEILSPLEKAMLDTLKLEPFAKPRSPSNRSKEDRKEFQRENYDSYCAENRDNQTKSLQTLKKCSSNFLCSFVMQ